MVTIPLRSDIPQYDFQVELDGQTYGLNFFWNDRSEAWFMGVSDADGPIVDGVRVVVGFPLGRRCRDARMPPGTFQAQDTTGAHQDPGLNDLGSRTQIYYIPLADLA